MKTEPTPSFESYREAYNWMMDGVDEPCVDNFRFAHQDDFIEMEKYLFDKAGGCCGSFDSDVFVGGVLCTIGCNYGH